MSSLRNNRANSIQELAPNIPLSQLLTLYGIQYELDWTEPVVPATNGKVYLRWQTHPTKYTIFTDRILRMDEERGFYRGYSTFTGGVAGANIPVYNIRQDTTIISPSIFTKYTAPTVDPADIVVEQPLFGQAGPGATDSLGDVDSEYAFRVYNPASDFMIEFENASTAPSYFRALLKWFEITPAAMPRIREL